MEQLTLQESPQLQHLQERHSKLQLQMDQLQQQLQQQENILHHHQQQQQSQQLKNSVQLLQEDGAAAALQNHSSVASNLPESDAAMPPESATDSLQISVTTSESSTVFVTLEAAVGHSHADIAEGGTGKDSRSVTSGDGAEGDSPSKTPSAEPGG